MYVQGMDYVFSTQSAFESSLASGDGSAYSNSLGSSEKNAEILAELEETVQRMYKEAKAEVKETKPSPAISCDMRIKHDARRGKMIEFVTTTPMSCSVEDATEILWKELTTYRDYPDEVYQCVSPCTVKRTPCCVVHRG